MADREIQHRAYARVGLLGNPSDAYFGNTISFSLANFWSEVTLSPSEFLVIRPHPRHDPLHFQSLQHLAGLSGSSAIICAALSCLLDFYDVGHFVKVEDRPSIILSAEEEIGITAGLQDRVIQVYGGLVYMDFKKTYMESKGHGMYIPMDVSLLPDLYLIYAENPSDSGKVHSSVRKRWIDGDALIRSRMEEVAELAVRGRSAIESHDHLLLAKLMNRNFELRRLMFGDEVLGEKNIRMVQIAQGVGAACKFTGSGGAAIAFCPNGGSQVKELQDACKAAGFTVERALIGPSFVMASSTNIQE